MTRRRLPNRHGSITFRFDCGGLAYVATFSRFADGELGEVFISNYRAGSAADTAAKDAAIVTSIALQFGADVETLRKGLCRDRDGRANSPLGVALDMIAEGRP